jgi:hypothetical protein
MTPPTLGAFFGLVPGVIPGCRKQRPSVIWENHWVSTIFGFLRQKEPVGVLGASFWQTIDRSEIRFHPDKEPFPATE